MKLCDKKKKKEREKWQVMNVRTEGQVWTIVNRERKRRRGVNKAIEMEE